jgi:molecular chaperone DnaK
VHVLQGEREQAVYNKTIGRFQLDGIPSAPRSMPQIEVAFDIDANGILSVSAKDQATGKEQHITITASSGLSEAEIDQMVKDAEAHAAEDQQKREEVEVHNRADSLIYETEKNLKEFGDKVDPATKSNVENAVEDLKKALESQNTEEIKAKTDNLMQIWHQASADLYKQTTESGEDASTEPPPYRSAPTDESEPTASSPEGEVIDADYEVVDDDKK